ncbi:hypothetical protein [Mesorhizobium atlanticum]|uniref:hypothetical protein n=1 Tax=Mesorhizobium atlanticum TaxID=2233532 RepID=UPI0011BE3DED|nr:hypothetical protein [Mesorhizobium atlanticum]
MADIIPTIKTKTVTVASVSITFASRKNRIAIPPTGAMMALRLVVPFFYFALLDNSAFAEHAPVLKNPISDEVGHYRNGVTRRLGPREVSASPLWNLGDQQPNCRIHVDTSSRTVKCGHVFKYQFDHREGFARRSLAGLVNNFVGMNGESQYVVGTGRPQFGQLVRIDVERLWGGFDAYWLRAGAIDNLQIVGWALARIPYLEDDLRQSLGVVFEPGFGDRDVGTGLSFADLATDSNSVFCRLRASFGMVSPRFGVLGRLSGIDGSGTGGNQSEDTNYRPDDNHPKGASSPVSGFLGRIGSLPLGAKIGTTVVLTGLAWGIGVFGLVGALNWRLTYRGRTGRSLLVLLGLGLFCLPAVLWW